MVLLKIKEMKKSIITSVLALLITGWSVMGAQDFPDEYLGLPGDNLNLYAVMKLFQESETLEGFERSLNSEDSRINNLDLNGDNMVDYLTASDYVDGNVHTIVLRAYLNQYESQDVAVFTVEQFGNGEVQVQLIGDEALYGKNYIIEPIYAETPNPGYRGNAVNGRNVALVTTTYYDIATWPVIMYIYHPRYVVWRSSWYWGYYPVYWDPWRPYYWHFYYGYHYNWYSYYHKHYRHWKHVRYNRYNTFYSSKIRSHSPRVNENIQRGIYRETYSRPDQRRAGEALYANTRASRQPNQVNTQRNRNNTTTRQNTAVSRTTTTTRSENRAVTRPTTSTEARSATRPTSRSENRTVTRPATRTETRSASTSNTSTTSRSTTTAPAKRSSSSRSTAARVSANKNSSKAARSTKSTVSSSSNATRNNKQVSKSTKTANKSKNARESKTGSTRRK